MQAIKKLPTKSTARTAKTLAKMIIARLVGGEFVPVLLEPVGDGAGGLSISDSVFLY